MLHTDELLSTTTDLENHFSTFFAGVQHLAGGRLSSYLIPYTTLGNTLLHVAEELAKLHLRWHVINTVLLLLRQFHHVRDKNNLYITCQIPLGYYPHPFNIYEIITFPIPTHVGANHSTMLRSVPPAMAIDLSLHLYFELTIAEMNTIVNHHTSQIRRPFSVAFNSVGVTSLFFGRSSDIKAFCEYDLYLENVKPQITQLEESQFLLLT